MSDETDGPSASGLARMAGHGAAVAESAAADEQPASVIDRYPTRTPRRADHVRLRGRGDPLAIDLDEVLGDRTAIKMLLAEREQLYLESDQLAAALSDTNDLSVERERDGSRLRADLTLEQERTRQLRVDLRELRVWARVRSILAAGGGAVATTGFSMWFDDSTQPLASVLMAIGAGLAALAVWLDWYVSRSRHSQLR